MAHFERELTFPRLKDSCEATVYTDVCELRSYREHSELGGEDGVVLKSSSSVPSVECSSRPSIRYERILSHSSC